MKLAGDVSLIVVTFLGTFYFTVSVARPLLLVYYPRGLVFAFYCR